MKYKEADLLIRIKNLDKTSKDLRLKSLGNLEIIDVFQHLNRIIALFEELGVNFDEMQLFYDDVAAGMREEYNRLPVEKDYPIMTLPGYDRWFRDIIEATQIAHTNYHEQQLAMLKALETSASGFVKKIIAAES